MKRGRGRGVLGLGLIAALLLLGPSAYADAPAQDAQEDAIRLYNEGAAASKAGRAKQALDLYVRAWQRHQQWQIAASLGRLEFTLKKYRDAAEHLEFAVREVPAEKREAVRVATQEMLEQAKASVGALNITVSPPGAEVLVDGKMVGKAPLPGVVFVEPGPVFVEARLAGYEGVRESRAARAGVVENANISLVKLQAQSQVVSVREPTTGPRSKIIVAGISLTALAAVSGAVFAIVSATRVDANDASVLAQCTPQKDGCASQSGIDSYNAHEKLRAPFATAAIWSFGIAGALGVGTATYALVTRGSSTRNAPRNAPPVGFAVDGRGGFVSIMQRW